MWFDKAGFSGLHIFSPKISFKDVVRFAQTSQKTERKKLLSNQPGRKE